MKRNNKNKISIFWLLVSFVLFSYISVFLINNIITVNNLIRETSLIKEDLSMVSEMNNSLRIEIEKLSTYDRIRKLSEDRIGLKFNENAIIKDKNIKIKKTEK